MTLSAVRSAPGIHLMAGAGAVAGLAVASVHRLTPAEVAALWSAVTLITGVISGLLQKPPHVAWSTATITALLGDMAALNIHVPPSYQGIGMAALSLFAGSVVHLSASRLAVVNVQSPGMQLFPPAGAAPAGGTMTVVVDNPKPVFPAN